MKQLTVILIVFTAVALSCSLSFGKTVHGTGGVRGKGIVQGKGIARGTGTASGTGMVIYRDGNGLGYKMGTGTVSGRGLAIGRGIYRSHLFK